MWNPHSYMGPGAVRQIRGQIELPDKKVYNCSGSKMGMTDSKH